MSGTIIGAVDLDAPDQARDALALATWLADMTASELLLVTSSPRTRARSAHSSSDPDLLVTGSRRAGDGGAAHA